jgi:hypothetical protein
MVIGCSALEGSCALDSCLKFLIVVQQSHRSSLGMNDARNGEGMALMVKHSVSPCGG